MRDSPGAVIGSAEHLRLASLGAERLPVMPQRGIENPIEFDQRGVSIVFDDHVFGRQLAFRQDVPHELFIEIGLYLGPAALMPHRVDEGDIGVFRPDLAGQVRVGVIDGADVFVEDSADRLVRILLVGGAA